jgi:hypothetical protein
MPGNDQHENRPHNPDATDGARLPQVSRRSLLSAAGVGAAGLAAGAFGGMAMASAATAGKPAAKPAAKQAAGENHGSDERQDSGASVVVHVREGRSGDLDIYHGTSHTRVNDPDLAARLRRTTR